MIQARDLSVREEQEIELLISLFRIFPSIQVDDKIKDAR